MCTFLKYLSFLIIFIILAPKLETVDELKEQVILLSKRVSHLTGLLHESEANCMRYTDQTKLLKEEIRR